MSIIQLVGAITSIAAGLGALTWIGRTLWKISNNLNDLVEDWRGERARPGVNARPGVMERLSNIEKRLSTVERHIDSIPQSSPTVNVYPPAS